MKDKRLFCANLLSRAGVHHLNRLFARDRLSVFSYHRISPKLATGSAPMWDDDVFGPTAEEFAEHLQILEKHTTVVGQDELRTLLTAAPGKLKGPYSMITFDDGYRDCYSVVYPELKRRGLPAVFFITVDFVNDRRVGWWDIIAYLVKQAALESPRRIAHQDESFLLPQEQTRCIRFFQREMKKAPQEQAVRLLEELSTLCGVPLPSRERQDEQIMTWDQIIEMSKNGMGIGSHTMSHRVLASLSAEEQTWELRESRQRIESILGQDVFAISYPVGGTDHLTPQTFRLAKESGYDLAFVFDFRSTRAKNCDPHAISRLYPVSDPQKFAAMVKFPRVMAYKQKSIVYPAVPSESPKPSN